MMARHDDSRQDQLAEADRLYEKYARPLEHEHVGEYIAVSSRGEVLVGVRLYDVVDTAERQFGPGNFIFKIGEKVAATWRWLTSA